MTHGVYHTVNLFQLSEGTTAEETISEGTISEGTISEETIVQKRCRDLTV